MQSGAYRGNPISFPCTFDVYPSLIFIEISSVHLVHGTCGVITLTSSLCVRFAYIVANRQRVRVTDHSSGRQGTGCAFSTPGSECARQSTTPQRLQNAVAACLWPHKTPSHIVLFDSMHFSLNISIFSTQSFECEWKAISRLKWDLLLRCERVVSPFS
jgi:hypothetical protein